MKFNDIILFILSFVKKTLQIELDDFFKKVHENDITITKQAFTQARRKVLPEAFIYLLDKINEGFYLTYGQLFVINLNKTIIID